MTEETKTRLDRTFPRLSRQGKVDFKVIEDPQRELPAAGIPMDHFQNICGGGIRFHTSEVLMPGIYLSVRIALPSLSDCILALGRVVACETPEPDESHTEVAVEFFWTGWGTAGVQVGLQQFISEKF